MALGPSTLGAHPVSTIKVDAIVHAGVTYTAQAHIQSQKKTCLTPVLNSQLCRQNYLLQVLDSEQCETVFRLVQNQLMHAIIHIPTVIQLKKCLLLSSREHITL